MHTRCTCSECIGTVASLETQSIQYYTVYPQVSTHMPCIVHIHTHVRTHAPSTRTRTHMHTHTLTHTHTHTGCVPVPGVQSAVPAVGECPLVSPGPGQQGAQRTGRETPGPPPETDSLHIQHCHCGGLAGEGGEDEFL